MFPRCLSLQYKDLLQLVLDATEEEEADMDPETSKGCPAGITEEGIVNITMDILLAGFDTTANSLCFITYLLALNPDIQGKLRSEITNYFQETPVRPSDKTTVHIAPTPPITLCVFSCPTVAVNWSLYTVQPSSP